MDAVIVWHSDPVDKWGSVECLKCKKSQSPHFTKCIYCCTHDILGFDYDWDEGLKTRCEVCGKNFDFRADDLILNYKAVRKEK